jgi:hypothetical protein
MLQVAITVTDGELSSDPAVVEVQPPPDVQLPPAITTAFDPAPNLPPATEVDNRAGVGAANTTRRFRRLLRHRIVVGRDVIERASSTERFLATPAHSSAAAGPATTSRHRYRRLSPRACALCNPARDPDSCHLHLR